MGSTGSLLEDRQIQISICVKQCHEFRQRSSEGTEAIITEVDSEVSDVITMKSNDFVNSQHSYDFISTTLDQLGLEGDYHDTAIINMREFYRDNYECDDWDSATEYMYCRITCTILSRVDEDEVMQQSMETQCSGMVPAARRAIRLLERKRIQVGDGESVSCMVCLEEFCDRDRVTCMPCSHMFHRVCLHKWLATSHVCPICRFEIEKKS